MHHIYANELLPLHERNDTWGVAPWRGQYDTAKVLQAWALLTGAASSCKVTQRTRTHAHARAHARARTQSRSDPRAQRPTHAVNLSRERSTPRASATRAVKHALALGGALAQCPYAQCEPLTQVNEPRVGRLGPRPTVAEALPQ